jgi:hypothetical protein
MLKFNYHNKPYDFSIFRVTGGDCPPRDKPGTRLKVMKFILENEAHFLRTHKGWILNCVHDMDLREEMCKLLRNHDAYYIVMPMARKAYLSATTREQKILEAIPVNRARNLAVTHGSKLANFIAVLDGDCYFDNETWNTISSFIVKDQISHPDRRFYSIPHTRNTMENVLHSNKPTSELSEPMPVFRSDAKIRFDDKIPFGAGDKLKLLYRIGHSIEPLRSHIVNDESICKSIGYVHHLATGDEITESNLQHRVKLRNEAIDATLHKLDTFVPKIRKPNEFWKTIQGWFDYQGLYSHFVFDCPENACIVEVGSWLGASTCYLATEAKNREKRVMIFAVDTWEGSNELQHKELISKMKAKNQTPYELFLDNMVKGGVKDIITPIRMSSVNASKLFNDESLDVVFIDASHEYEDVLDDIRCWLPKIKRGGKIGGHDYVPGHPASDAGVVKAVNRFFNGMELEISPAGRTWLHHKK